MNQPTSAGASPPWFLIIGLLAGVSFVGYIVWDSAKSSPSRLTTSENVVELTEANWRSEVIESKIPVFIDFTASWCPPCRQFAPTVNRLADRYKGKIKVAKFDVGDRSMSKGGEITFQYGINAIPHVMIFKGGSQVHQFRGQVGEVPLAHPGSEGELAKVFDKLLESQ